MLAKLIVIILIVFGEVPHLPTLPFLPFLHVFDNVAPSTLLQRTLQLVMIASMAGIALGRAVRLACFAFGSALLLSILLSRTYWSNGHTYTGLLLVLIALYEPRRGMSMVRAQVVLLYLSAGLSKLWQPDWRSGQYASVWIDFMGHSVYETFVSRDLYPWLVRAAAPHDANVALCWMAIATELTIGIGLALRPRIAIPLGVGFHAGLTLISGITFQEFLFVVASSYVVFLRWPERVELSYDPQSPAGARFAGWVRVLDADRLFAIEPGGAGAELSVRVDGRPFAGAPAVLAALLHLPASYFVACAALVAAKVLSMDTTKRLDVAIGLVLMAGTAVCTVLAARGRVGGRQLTP
jgi:hypothetical protein